VTSDECCVSSDECRVTSDGHLSRVPGLCWDASVGAALTLTVVKSRLELKSLMEEMMAVLLVMMPP